ncbi:unnamed protein product [Periconia digitata]|uniref:Secreted protein n=1 Tax=Periconia digitata TaxID=1303443 RepID=A0A9W4UAY8_9PLEO|nr:unnamed protein product [Periconia digitata]
MSFRRTAIGCLLGHVVVCHGVPPPHPCRSPARSLLFLPSEPTVHGHGHDDAAVDRVVRSLNRSQSSTPSASSTARPRLRANRCSKSSLSTSPPLSTAYTALTSPAAPSLPIITCARGPGAYSMRSLLGSLILVRYPSLIMVTSALSV